LNLLLGAVATIALVVLATPITEQFAAGGDPEVLRWLSIAIGLHAVSVVPVAVLRRKMAFGRAALTSFVAYTTGGLVAVAIGVLGGGVWALVARLVLYEAMLALLSVVFARTVMGAALHSGGDDDDGARRRGGGWFFALALANFVAFNADYLIVGRFTDAERLGLYALAFLVAFAPLRQFSWQIGSVLFSASAATDGPELIRRRLVTSLRLGSSLLLPGLVPAIVLAPVVLPGVLGEEWASMVPVFQLLVAAGVAHAVVNIGAEFLSGTGHVDLRSWISIGWAGSMVVALLVVVPSHGIVGAAAVHLGSIVPLGVATTVLGARRLDARLRTFWLATRGVVGAVLAQAVVTAGLVVALGTWGGADSAAAIVAALAGIVVAGVLLSTGDDAPWPTVLQLVQGGVLRRSGNAAS